MRIAIPALILLFFSSSLYAQQPSVKTRKVSEVSYNCARVLANSTGTDVTQRGICYSVNANQEKADVYIKFGTGSFGGYSTELVDLVPETKYFVRAYAICNKVYCYGEELSFTTLAMPVPDVITLSCSEITKNSARIQGRVSGPEIMECGVYFSEIQDDENNGTYKPFSTKGFGNYSLKLNKLKRSTTYYARFYAKNRAGIKFGKVISFTTTE